MKALNMSRNFLTRLFYLLFVLGLILCLGSILSFIVMNIVFGQSPSIEAIYWQRLFVSKITFVLIIPGLILFVLGSFLLIYNSHNYFKPKMVTSLQIFIFIIMLNSVIIIFIEERASNLAVIQHIKNIVSPEYSELKSKEDILGAVNFIIFLCCLCIGIFFSGNKECIK